jgi:hypothetical protein
MQDLTRCMSLKKIIFWLMLTRSYTEENIALRGEDLEAVACKPPFHSPFEESIEYLNESHYVSTYMKNIQCNNI